MNELIYVDSTIQFIHYSILFLVNLHSAQSTLCAEIKGAVLCIWSLYGCVGVPISSRISDCPLFKWDSSLPFSPLPCPMHLCGAASLEFYVSTDGGTDYPNAQTDNNNKNF